MLVQAPGRLGPGTKHVLVGRQKACRPGTHLSAIRQAVAALWTRSGQEGGTKKAMGSLWCVVSEGLSPRNRRRNWGTQHMIKGRKHVSGGCQASAKALRQEPPLSLCGQSRTRGGRQDQVIGRGGGRCLCVEGCVGPCNPRKEFGFCSLLWDEEHGEFGISLPSSKHVSAIGWDVLVEARDPLRGSCRCPCDTM